MKGTPPQKLSSPEPRSGARVCSEPGCRTRLSVYNGSDRCWQHTESTFPNFRGKRLQDPRRD